MVASNEGWLTRGASGGEPLLGDRKHCRPITSIKPFPNQVGGIDPPRSLTYFLAPRSDDSVVLAE